MLVKFLETLAQHAAQTRNEVDHGPFLSYEGDVR